LTLGFEPFLGNDSHFLPFTLAVIISAWYGGLIFGLIATAVSFLVVAYFFLPPVLHVVPIHPHAYALLALFLVVGVSISILQSTLADANEALKKSREHVELAAEAGRIGFAESFGGDQVVWSPEMERLFGLQAGGFEGTVAGWLRRIHPEDREKFENERRRQIEQGLPELKFEYRAVLPDGQIRWLEGRRRLMVSETGVLNQIVSANIDITERHNLEQALTLRSQELKQSNQELERFAYTVAHDLQSPLRAVETLTQLFLKRTRRELDLESTNLLDLVVSSADRMRRLVDQMLELARAAHAPAVYAAVDTAAVAKMAADNARNGAIECSISIGALPTIQADESQLQRVFENLIGNALKYCGNGKPEVQVDASLEGSEWVFSVRDNGIGIDPADHQRIFDEFERLHSAAQYAGSGIGLSVCRQIVQRHHGRIWVESLPGEGATFRFTIPHEPPDLTVAKKPAGSEGGADRNRAAAG
jgi:PAS domain S-box-containing protein